MSESTSLLPESLEEEEEEEEEDDEEEEEEVSVEFEVAGNRSIDVVIIWSIIFDILADNVF